MKAGSLNIRILLGTAFAALVGIAVTYWALSTHPQAVPSPKARNSNNVTLDEPSTPLRPVPPADGYRQMAPRFN